MSGYGVLIALIIFSYGLIAGSFVNAWIWRLKTDESVVKGRSKCPDCGHVLSGRDLIPLISWIFLRGKCRYCSSKISFRYPLIELTTAVLFLTSYLLWSFSSISDVSLFILWLLMLITMVAIASFDLLWQLIPTIPVIAWSVLAVTYQAVLVVSNPDYGLSQVISVGFAVIFFVGIFYLLARYPRKQLMGLGDVYLMVPIAITLGFLGTLISITLGSFIGTIIALPFLISKKWGRETRLPFGPLLIIGTYISFFWADYFAALLNFDIY